MLIERSDSARAPRRAGTDELMGCDSAENTLLSLSFAFSIVDLADGIDNEPALADGGGRRPPERYDGQRERSSGSDEPGLRWVRIAAAWE